MPVRTVADPATIAATRILLSQIGITPADMLTDTGSVPTFGEAIPETPHHPHPRHPAHLQHPPALARKHLAHRRLDEISTAELDHRARHVQANIRTNRATRNGASARQHFISAARCLYRYAEDNNWIHPTAYPARNLTIPVRPASQRQAIPSPKLAEIYHITSITGDDRELDTLLLRLHIETACRRSGALNLRPCDLDPHNCLILLREKNGIDRWQPVSPTLMAHLQHHARQRHSPSEGQLLRYHNGKPITRRRYDHLWHRIGTHLPWVAAQHITTHWLRHTTLTWVERAYGYATARAYAGHHTRTHGTTATYVKADLYEIATALATPENHTATPLTPPATRSILTKTTTAQQHKPKLEASPGYVLRFSDVNVPPLNTFRRQQ
ncbi:site-specific recombinase XerD [Nocardia tenerifensis]|uniref:Site-specific recombinase XerD n=1 Tax=Nocardia tenerifensis TaxID=228006 RepID=A0A318JWF8_9NOCA|nr:site-specific integrase [Nocardia tenerifensis]PXX61793.1 site-specific recombinase XerD [Nocardia tenerifensis]